jgi:hypothetical protein
VPSLEPDRSLSLRRAVTTGVVTVAVYGPVLLTHWYAPPDVPSLQQLLATQARWLAESQAKLGAVTVVDPSAGHLLSPEARRLAVQGQNAARDRVVAIASVVPGSGFRAAIVRSVITGVAVLSRLRAVEMAFSESRPASAWLATALRGHGTVLDEGLLLRAVEEILAARPST